MNFLKAILQGFIKDKQKNTSYYISKKTTTPEPKDN